jgi:CheY-like chemotaxis protein
MLHMVGMGRKILLADDEENIRILGEKLLREAGYKVVLAANGEEAISKAIAERPDLVITDIRMPLKNGFEVCRALRSDPVLAHVPIIILSAFGDEFNKLTGFEGGADDYITKPFRAEELEQRISLLLERVSIKHHINKRSIDETSHDDENIKQISTGIAVLDKILMGGLVKGSNVLLLGSMGKGKSTFARKFIAEGLKEKESGLFITVDDSASSVRSELNKILPAQTKEYEDKNLLRFIDAYSWSLKENYVKELFKIEGVLSLDQLSDLIGKAGADIGQSLQKKAGGRRVIDSISSFFVNFELPAVQRFLTSIGKTALSFGGVSTLFIAEEGAANEHIMNNIKYLMDGIIEFKEENGKRKIRAMNMKWLKNNTDWMEW